MYLLVEYYADSDPRTTPWESEAAFIAAQAENRVWARRCPLPARIHTLSQALKFRAWDMGARKVTFSRGNQK